MKLFNNYSLFISFMLLAIIGVTNDSYATESGIKVNQLAPDFEVVDLKGRSFKLSDFKGKKPVYLIFWATWCPACKREIPHIKKIYEEYGNNLEILAVNVDSLSWWSSLKDSDKSVNSYVEKHNLPYAVALDDKQELMELYKVQGTPTQLLIDKDGVIRQRYHTYSEKTEAILQSLMPAE